MSPSREPGQASATLMGVGTRSPVGRYAFRSHRVGERVGSRPPPGPAPHRFLANNVWLNIRTTRYTAAIPEALDQLRSQSTISAAPRSFTNSQKPSALTRMASTTPNATALGACGSDISGHDLVDTLPAQTEVVGNLGQRLPPLTGVPDVPVPLVLATGARPQRTPLPSGEHLQGTDTVRRKFTFTVPLPGVVHPIAELQRLSIENFGVDRRDCAMIFPHPELIERTNVQKELLRMIHTSIIVREVDRYNSTYSLSTYGGGKHHG